jgi:hypothetical protein
LIKLAETEDFVIYDDVMEKDQLTKVWQGAQMDDYSLPHIGGWSKVWRATDGAPMGGKSYEVSEKPFGNYMDPMNFYISTAAKLHQNIIKSWSTLILRSYIYPRGTKLNWHNDMGYLGAAIFYIHPEWASTWGGELMIAKTPESSQLPPPHLDHREEDKFLERFGLGSYITCKPNRLVLTRAGVWHSINRVDPDAGDHCRAAIVGFFK